MAMHHRQRHSPPGSNPFTGRGLPANSPYRDHGNSSSSGSNRGPIMASAMAKKALLIVLAFTAFFYIASSGVDDPTNHTAYVAPSQKSSVDDGGVKKLVLPPGGDGSGGGDGVENDNNNDADSRGDGGSGGLGGGVGDYDGRDTMGGGADSADKDGEGSRRSFGGDGESNKSNSRDLENADVSNDGGNEGRSPNDEDMDFRNNDRTFDAAAMEGGGGLGNADSFIGDNHMMDSQGSDNNDNVDASNYSADSRAPPSRDEPSEDQQQLTRGGLRGGMSRSSGGGGGDSHVPNNVLDKDRSKSQDDNNDLFGRDEETRGGGGGGTFDNDVGDQRGNTPLSGSSDRTAEKLSNSNDAVNESSYMKRDKGLSMEKALTGNVDHVSKHMKYSDDETANKYGHNPGGSLYDNKSKSGDAEGDTFYKHQDQMAIPRAEASRSKSIESGHVGSEDESATRKKHYLDAASETKGSGDGVSYKKKYSDATKRKHSTYEKNIDAFGATNKDSSDGKVSRDYLKSDKASTDQDLGDAVSYKKKHHSHTTKEHSSDEKKYRESAKKSDEMYLKLKEDFPYRKPIIDSDKTKASEDVIPSYHKRVSDDHKEDSADPIMDSDKRKSSENIIPSYRKRGSDDVSSDGKFRESAKKSGEMYNKLKESTHHEPMVDSDKKKASEDVIPLYHKRVSDGADASKDSSDGKVREYLGGALPDRKSIIDSDKTKLSDDVASYKKTYSDTKKDHSSHKKHPMGDVVASPMEGGNTINDALQKVIHDGAVDDEERYSGKRKHSSHKHNFDEVGASIKKSDATGDSRDTKTKYADFDDKRIGDSHHLSEGKTAYSDTKGHSSYIDEIGSHAKKSDETTKEFHELENKYEELKKKEIAEMEASPDSDKDVSEVKTTKNVDSEDEDLTGYKERDGDSDRKEKVSAVEDSSDQKLTAKMEASADAVKDSSGIKRYADSDGMGSVDPKLDVSEVSNKEVDDIANEKVSSYKKSIAETKGTLDETKKSSNAVGSEDKGSINQKLVDSEDPDKKEGGSADNEDSTDTALKLKASDDAAKDSSVTKGYAGSDGKGSSDQKLADSEESIKKEGGNVDVKDSSDEKLTAKAEASADVSKDSSEAKKSADSDNASGDEKEVDVETASKKSVEIADKKSHSSGVADYKSSAGSIKDLASQESAKEVEWSDATKESSDLKEKEQPTDKVSADDEESSVKKFVEIEASKDSDDLKDKKVHAGSKKPSSDQKNTEEGAASDDKKSEVTKNSSDVAEKKSEASQDQTDTNKVGESEKANVEEGESKKKSGLLSGFHLKKEKESDADAEKAPTEEAKEDGESENESDGKKKGVLSKLHLRKKKAEDSGDTDAAPEEDSKSAKAKLDPDEGKSPLESDADADAEKAHTDEANEEGEPENEDSKSAKAKLDQDEGESLLESDAGAEKAPTKEAIEEGEPENESDKKQNGVLSKLHLRKKKAKDSVDTVAAPEEDSKSARVKLSQDEGKSS